MMGKDKHILPECISFSSSSPGADHPPSVCPSVGLSVGRSVGGPNNTAREEKASLRTDGRGRPSRSIIRTAVGRFMRQMRTPERRDRYKVMNSRNNCNAYVGQWIGRTQLKYKTGPRSTTLYPLHTRGWFYIRPSVGSRATLFLVSSDDCSRSEPSPSSPPLLGKPNPLL